MQDDLTDVVYTWVNDRQPGYHELLSQHAEDSFDRDPGRTRDFLELIRFSLRSLEKNFTGLGKVFILTMRPQVPAWLDVTHPGIKIIHHDEIMEPSALPTFNSLAIVSHLHLIPGLSERFLYVEDDVVFTRPCSIHDFITADGQMIYRQGKWWAPRWQDIKNPEKERPWNMALAEANKLLDEKFGVTPRRQLAHAPLVFSKEEFAKALAMIPDQVQKTRLSKFRKAGNVAMEFFIPHVSVCEGKAELVEPHSSGREAGYVPLLDLWPVTLWDLACALWHRAKWMNFNDNLGPNPSRTTEFLIGKFLSRQFPEASRFERDA